MSRKKVASAVVNPLNLIRWGLTALQVSYLATNAHMISLLNARVVWNIEVLLMAESVACPSQLNS